MYKQVETDTLAVYENGSEFFPVATLANENGGRCQIDIDDHCYVISLIQSDGRYRMTPWIFHEAHNVLKSLPSLSQVPDLREFYEHMIDDYHMWDENIKGKYPVERVFKAMVRFIQNTK